MKIFAKILVLSICTLALSGCNAKTPASNSNPSREDCISSCNVMWKTTGGNEGRSESEMDKDCGSLCDAGQGIQNQDVSSCAKAEGILRDTCYGDIAKKTNDPTLCEKIESQMFVSTCYISIVEIRKDKSLCEKVPVKMMKDSCLSD